LSVLYWTSLQEVLEGLNPQVPMDLIC
jgi:hypothetical protein